MPKVSVIIPLYNAHPYLAELKQLWEQTLNDFELILVDDCSQDDTWEQLQRFKSDYPERTIILARNERNLGPGGTRNHGLSLSSGQYVIFLDGDDRYEPTMLEKMAAKLDETCADVVCCGLYHHHQDGQSKAILFTPDFVDQTDIYNQMKRGIADKINLPAFDAVLFHPSILPYPWNKMVRHEFLQANHITFPDLCTSEDRCWVVQLVLKAQKIVLINEPLYHYIKRPNSITTENSARTLSAILAQLEFEHQALSTYSLLPGLDVPWQLYYWNTVLFYLKRLEQSSEPQRLQQHFIAQLDAFCAQHQICNDAAQLPLSGRFPCYKFIPKITALLSQRAQLKAQYQLGRYIKRFNQLRAAVK